MWRSRGVISDDAMTSQWRNGDVTTSSAPPIHHVTSIISLVAPARETLWKHCLVPEVKRSGDCRRRNGARVATACWLGDKRIASNQRLLSQFGPAKGAKRCDPCMYVCLCLSVRPYIWKSTIRYDARCYFNMRSKADISHLNLPRGTNN